MEFDFDIDDLIHAHEEKAAVEEEVREKEIENEKKGIVGPQNPYGGQTVEVFPIHLYPPRGAETFDQAVNKTLSAPDLEVVLIDWTIPDGVVGFWRAYSFFTNTPVGVTAEWKITVNGQPALKYHGDPQDDFRKTLALSNDLANTVDALQELKAGDRIVIKGIVSDSTIPCSIAARIMGWLITDRIAISRVGS